MAKVFDWNNLWDGSFKKGFNPFGCSTQVVTGFLPSYDPQWKPGKPSKPGTFTLPDLDPSLLTLVVVSEEQCPGAKDWLLTQGFQLAVTSPRGALHPEGGTLYLLVYRKQGGVVVGPATKPPKGLKRLGSKVANTLLKKRKLRGEVDMETLLVLGGLMLWSGITTAVAYALAYQLGLL